MVEYRFVLDYKEDKLWRLNSEMPKGKKFVVDTLTGEAWCKITNSEHTIEQERTVRLFMKFSSEIIRTLSIKDCSLMKHTATYSDDRESLF